MEDLLHHRSARSSVLSVLELPIGLFELAEKRHDEGIVFFCRSGKCGVVVEGEGDFSNASKHGPSAWPWLRSAGQEGIVVTVVTEVLFQWHALAKDLCERISHFRVGFAVENFSVAKTDKKLKRHSIVPQKGLQYPVTALLWKARRKKKNA